MSLTQLFRFCLSKKKKKTISIFVVINYLLVFINQKKKKKNYLPVKRLREKIDHYSKNLYRLLTIKAIYRESWIKLNDCSTQP